MAYNIAQYRLRSLADHNETVPNQLGKEIQTLTMCWIFQLMEGIRIIHFFDEDLYRPIKEMVTNLNQLRKKIIHHFGNTAYIMYGLIPKKKTAPLEM